jgi:hypothetical protein
MVTLLFVNKPITFFLYLLGVVLMVLISCQDDDFWFTSLWLIPAYSIIYCSSLPYFYLFRGREKIKVGGVNIKAFKTPMKVYWFMSLIGFIISLIVFINTYVVFFAAFVWLFYNLFCLAILRCYIFAKFFSLAVKNNPTVKDFKIQEIYNDMRDVLMKKVIS